MEFGPLVPGGHKVPNTNMYRAPEHLRDDEKAFGRWAADRISEAIEFEGPDSVAAARSADVEPAPRTSPGSSASPQRCGLPLQAPVTSQPCATG